MAHELFDAFTQLFSMDPDVVNALRTSFSVSLSAILIAGIIAFPLGLLFGLAEFRGRRFIDIILNTLLFLPTVVVGLLGYMLLTRDGPLGQYHLLFTPAAIVFGQVILALPIILTMVSNSIRASDPRIIPTALSLGVGKLRAYIVLLGEIRGLILLTLLAAFARVISEIGASTMLGGNILGKTRTITTSISVLASQGETSKALALGVVLLFLVFAINIAVYAATHRSKT
ncbi:MAG: ABC transporter permease [bacterium]|nr:ABC transporter permease [bacterium]